MIAEHPHNRQNHRGLQTTGFALAFVVGALFLQSACQHPRWISASSRSSEAGAPLDPPEGTPPEEPAAWPRTTSTAAPTPRVLETALQASRRSVMRGEPLWVTIEFRNQGNEAALVRSSPYQWTCFLTTTDERGVEVPSPWRPAQDPELGQRRVLKPGEQMSIVVLANACVAFPRAGLYTLSYAQERAQPSSLKIRVTDLEPSARQETAQQLIKAYREWGKAPVPHPYQASTANDLLQLIAHTGWLEVADLLFEEIETKGFALQGNRYLLEGLIAIPNRQEVASGFRTRLARPSHGPGTLDEAYDGFRKRTEGQRPAG